MQDSYRHKGMRRRLIEGLRAKGIHDETVLAAMMRVPRHLFLDKAFEEIAYEDRAFPIGADQTISQPYTVAYQTQLLQPQPGQKVLEIGTGSGYQACVLAEMHANVFTIERQESLCKKARAMFEKLGYPQIAASFGDGYLGLPQQAPFDRILVTAGAPFIPEALKNQLAIGGSLVIPVGEGGTQYMYRVTRKSATEFETMILEAFRFVPFLPGTEGH